MYYKKTNFFNKYVLTAMIVVIVLVLFGIVYVAISLAGKGEKEVADANLQSQNQNDQMLDLTVSSSEPNQESVTIVAQVKNVDDFKSLILPDGRTIVTPKADYVVTANGEYKFGVYKKDGTYLTYDIKITNVKEKTANEPYIPDGFKYVTGKVNDGYVIQDKYGNEFVWVPVENGIPVRDKANDTRYQDNSTIVTEFLNSVAKNKGYYIARYEASQGVLQNNQTGQKISVPLSRPGMYPWTSISYDTAKIVSENMARDLGYQGVKTSIASSYAWCTVLEWIDKSTQTNYSMGTDHGNYSQNIAKTGATESDMINNIADLAGNVREWTTETLQESGSDQDENSVKVNRVLRGGSTNIANTPLKISAFPGSVIDNFWGFRVVLFKN